jgi:hypothetical protein
MDHNGDVQLAWLPTLPAVTEKQLYRLLGLLWALEFCQPCATSDFSAACLSRRCPKRTAIEQYKGYIGYYKKTCASYDPLSDGDAAIRSHDDLRRIAQELRLNSESSKAQIRKLVFPTEGDAADEDNAINLAVSISLMLNCGSQDSSPILLEEGCNRITWRSGITLAQYIELVLPRIEDGASHRSGSRAFLDTSRPMVMAKELKRRAGTRFYATDDITNHLRYDDINNVLFIFHHTRFLKDQLRLSLNSKDDGSVLECLKL